METTGQVRGKACDQSWFLGKSLSCEKVQGRFVICHRKKMNCWEKEKRHAWEILSLSSTEHFLAITASYVFKKKKTEKTPPTAPKLREPFTSHPLPVLICRFSPHPSWLEVLLTGGRERGQEASLCFMYIQKKFLMVHDFTKHPSPTTMFGKTKANLAYIFKNWGRVRQDKLSPRPKGISQWANLSPCQKQRASCHCAWLHFVCPTTVKSKHILPKACQLLKTNIFGAAMHSICTTWLFGEGVCSSVHP